MFSVPRTPGSPGFGDESGMSLVSPSQRDVKPTLAELEAMSPAEIAAIQGKLNLRLGPEYIAQRPSPGGGGKLTYVEGWRIIMLANEVFGYNGWSSSIVKLETDFCDVNEEYGTRRVSCGISAMVRVTLKDGTYHEDVGYGTADNLKSKGAALDKAKKEAVTDGVKRALRNFGNLLGLCLYEKQFTQEIVKIKAQPKKLDPSELYRNAANTPAPGAPSPQPVAGPSVPPPQQQQIRQDVKPMPSNMRSVIQAAVKAGPDYKGKAPATPSPLNPTRNTGLNTPAYTPAAPTGQQQQRPPSRAMPPQQQPDRASPFAAAVPRPTTAQPVTPLAAPPQPVQPAQRALPARVPSPPRRGPSPPPAKPEPVEEADSLDSFFNSEDDAMFAAYDGEGVESPAPAPAPVQQQQPSRTYSQSSASGGGPRPPSQSAGGFRFPQGVQQQHGGRSSTSNNAAQPRPSTSAGNNVARTSTGNAGNGAPRAHATNGNWRQHNQSAGTVTGAPVVAGVKRSAEALNVPAKRPINGQGMGLAHQNQRPQPTNLELGAGGDPKRMRR